MTVIEISTLGGLIISGAVAWWGYKRTRKSDAVSEQSGVATETRAGTQQIIDGLNTLIDQYQEGAALHKEAMHYLQERLDAVLAENTTLKMELARIRHKYGENGPTKGT